MRRLEIATSNAYYYDPAEVERLYAEFKPSPDLYGDDHAYALWCYLHDSPLGHSVFEDRGDFDQWLASDAESEEDD